MDLPRPDLFPNGNKFFPCNAGLTREYPNQTTSTSQIGKGHNRRFSHRSPSLQAGYVSLGRGRFSSYMKNRFHFLVPAVPGFLRIG